jgi:hypothetical protein
LCEDKNSSQDKKDEPIMQSHDDMISIPLIPPKVFKTRWFDYEIQVYYSFDNYGSDGFMFTVTIHK